MASLTFTAPLVRARARVLADLPTLVAVLVSGVFSVVFIARTAFKVGSTTYFSLFDDAMVSMRYARNLAHGDGLVWNPHQPAVEGYTNFLWTLWMSVLHFTPIPESKISLAVMVSGALLLAANVVLIGSIAQQLGATHLVRTLAMAATALYYPLVYWTLRGMEVGLLTFVVSAATLLVLRLERESSRRVSFPLCVLVVVGSLTRPDATVLMLCFVAYVAWTSGAGARVRCAGPLLAAVLLAVLAATAFRELYYHALLPNTYYLKMTGVPLTDRLHRGAAAFYNLELDHLWAPTVAVAALLVSRRRIDRRLGLLLFLFTIAALYSIYVGGDAWEWMAYSNRYIAPTVPLLLVLAALGVGELLSSASRRRAAFVTVGIGTTAIFGLASLSDIVTAGVDGLASAPVPAFAPLLLALFPMLLIAERRRQGPLPRAVNTAFTAILLFVAVDLVPIVTWVGNAGYHVRDDQKATRLGLELAAETAPSTTVAVIWAGAIPYFSNRPSIDLLGKSDPVVARRPSRRPFFPGHSKWDYSYSIVRLRPDIVAQGLWPPRAGEGRLLTRWGYHKVQETGTNKWSLYIRNGEHVLRPPV